MFQKQSQPSSPLGLNITKQASNTEEDADTSESRVETVFQLPAPYLLVSFRVLKASAVPKCP